MDHARGEVGAGGLGAREASIPKSGKFKMRVEIDLEEEEVELDLGDCNPSGNGSEDSLLREVCLR